MRKLLMILISVMLSINCAHALVKIKAQGRVESKNKKPKAEERQQAIRNGQQQALRKYIAELDSQRRILLDGLMQQLLDNIDDYILETIPLTDGEYQNGAWQINLQLSIDDGKIEQLIRDNTQKLEQHYLSFIFVAREVESISSQEQATLLHEGDRNRFTQGISLVKNSEGIIYRSYNPAEIDNKITEVFNKAGFEVVPAFELNITSEQFAFDFALLGEISSSTQKEATNIARDEGLDFLALGTLDLGQEEIDPVTGQYRAFAKVGAYIMDLRKKFATKICSVGPVQYSGLGPNPTVAKTNALIEASTKASQDMIDQLRLKLTTNK